MVRRLELSQPSDKTDRSSDDLIDDRVKGEGARTIGFVSNEFFVRDGLLILKQSMSQLTSDHLLVYNDSVSLLYLFALLVTNIAN